MHSVNVGANQALREPARAVRWYGQASGAGLRDRYTGAAMLPDSAITDSAYQDALRWLYHLSPNLRTAAQIVADHPRKLGRMRALLDELGNPDARCASVLVAGTKGKGSIAAMVEAMLHATGVRTGLVTSPHLMSWCERTRIDGADIMPGAVGRLMPTVRAAMDRLAQTQPALGQATTFEAGLALSLLAFAEAGVRVAVVEAGVGGLHDASNVLDPLAVALGPVSYDHTATLGPTLASIAQEKCGIFRRNRLAVTAAQPPEAQQVIEQAAADTGAHLERVGAGTGADWRWLPESARTCNGPFSISGPRGSFAHLTMPLLGRHQRENATLAVALATGVLEALGRPPQPAAIHSTHGESRQQQADTADVAVRAGLATVRWPGRLQVVRERPWLVVDGAHNGDSAARLAEALAECFPAATRHLVFGTSVGKDVVRMLDALLPATDRVTVTRSHHERSVPLDDLALALGARGRTPAAIPDVRDAVADALQQAAPDDLIIVTGSLFVVGEALEAFGVSGPGNSGQGER
jgi:dihydrofolate synthase/folylpolyglutamate synthase